MSAPIKIACLSSEDHWVNKMAQHFKRLPSCEVKLFAMNTYPSREAIVDELKKFAPHFCYFQNYYAFDFVPENKDPVRDYIVDSEIPFVSWFVDNPYCVGTILLQAWWQNGPHPKSGYFLCLDRTDVDFFRSKGMKAEYFPFSVDSQLENFKPNPTMDAEFKDHVSFVATPPPGSDFSPGNFANHAAVYCFKRIENIWGWLLHTEVKERPEWFSSFPEFYNSLQVIIAEFFQTRVYDIRKFDALVRDFFENKTKDFPDVFAKGIGYAKGALEFQYSWLILTEFCKQLQNSNLQLYGGEMWKTAIPGYKGSARRLTTEEAMNCFSASDISICLTKMQFRTALHERVLLVLGAGGFPLTDWRADTEEYFSKDEVATFISPDEANDLIRFYKERPELRRQMTQKAREKMFKNYTFEKRLPPMLRQVGEHFQISELKNFPEL